MKRCTIITASRPVVKTKGNIERSLSQFLIKTTTMTFCYLGQDHEFAVATAKHRYLTISGIKFVEHFVDVVYQLREEQGSWKIWTKQDTLKPNVKTQNRSSCSRS